MYKTGFKGWLVLLAVAVFIGLLPFQAAAAEEQSLEIRLKAGETTVEINGERIEVEAPYVTRGTTMVPLRVITKAFGARLQLENNRIITLTYGDTTVVVTIGSNVVTINGEAVTLTAEAKVIQGVTMVPLRVISQAFGANVAFDSPTGIVTITGDKVGQAASGGGSGLIADASYTHVGDSYYQWTMRYPTGLAMVQQGDSGDFVQWQDAATGASVLIIVREEFNALTREEKRRLIEGYYDSNEFTTDRRTLNLNGLSVEKMVSRTRDGRSYEYRGIQANDYFYIAAVGISGDKVSLDDYQALLDSFMPSFTAGNSAVKDITKVQDGLMTVVDEQFGLTVKLPVNWYRDRSAPAPLYLSEDGMFRFDISSAMPGDTADSWMKRELEQLKANYAPGYLRNFQSRQVRLSDGMASVQQLEFSWDKKKWYTAYDVFLIVGNYRYYLDFYVPTTEYKDGLFNQIISSIDIDTDYVEQNFASLEDAFGEQDEFGTTTKTSRKYGYSVALPVNWYPTASDFEASFVEYVSNRGEISIEVVEGTTALELAADIRAYLSSLQAQMPQVVRLGSSGTAQIGGKTAQTIVVDFLESSDGKPYQTQYYAVEHKGRVLLFIMILNHASASESNIKLLDDVIASVKFN